MLFASTLNRRSSAEIVPEAALEPVVEMYTAEAEERLLGGRPDYVLDAIDNIDTKARSGGRG